MKSSWYKKWWVWLIAVIVVAGIVVGILAATGVFDGKKEEPKPIETTVAVTTAAPTTAAPTTAPAKETVDDIINKGYQKVGHVALYNNIDNYKGKKILTAVQVRDIVEKAFYAFVTKDNKPVAYYSFLFDDKNDLKDIKKNEYAVVYGEVSANGLRLGTIEVEKCGIVLTAGEALDFFKSLKDEDPKVPATTPVTTVAPTTEAQTTAPATAAPVATTAPAAKAPETDPVATTQPATKGDDNILYNDNGIKITYTNTVRNEYAYEFMIEVENKSGKDLFVGTKDATVNGKAVDLIAYDLIDNGKTSSATLYILRADLDDDTAISNLKFKFLFDDPNDWNNPIITDEITLNPGDIIEEHITE